MACYTNLNIFAFLHRIESFEWHITFRFISPHKSRTFRTVHKYICKLAGGAADFYISVYTNTLANKSHTATRRKKRHTADSKDTQILGLALNELSYG